MKKLLAGVAASALTFPGIASAAPQPSPDELLKRLEELTKELQTVKEQLEEVKNTHEETKETVIEVSEQVDEIVTDGVARLDLSGDYRFRLDSARADTHSYWSAQTIETAMSAFEGMGYTQEQINAMLSSMSAEQRAAMLQSMGYSKTKGYDADNDTLYTNRLRLNLKADATENVSFKGRLAMYKIWGMEKANATASPFFGNNGFYWDPNVSRRPNDDTLRVEMAYVNWTNIGGLPIWFSVGRRPTVDGPPLNLKLNIDKRYATPVGLGVDWTFDGATLGYAYEDPFPGKIRICYGRGYESGFKDIPGEDKLDDVDLIGVNWDVIDDKDENLFANLQLFKAGDIPDFLSNENIWGLPEEPTGQLGDIYHLSGIFQHQLNGIDWFVSGGLSRTDNRGTGFGGYGLLNNPGEDDNHWGWAAFAGVRVPVEQLNSKIGFEYNYGSQYWINFTPAADDLYQAKLSTRGHVGEIYWIWDLPETPLSKYGRAFIRAGYQYYWFDYTGSGNWLGKPIDIDDLDDPMNAQLFAPVDTLDNAYVTFEVYF